MRKEKRLPKRRLPGASREGLECKLSRVRVIRRHTIFLKMDNDMISCYLNLKDFLWVHSIRKTQYQICKKEVSPTYFSCDCNYSQMMEMHICTVCLFIES